MHLWADAWIIIQRTERQANKRVICVEFAQDRRSADTAEAAMVPGRGFIKRQ